MLGESAVLDTHYVDDDPIHRLSDSRKTAMEHDNLTVGSRQCVLVTQFVWQGFDKPEEPITSRRDMSAVLNVGGRPEVLRCSVVPLVEERIERFQHERCIGCFVLSHGAYLQVRRVLRPLLTVELTLRKQVPRGSGRLGTGSQSARQ